MSRAGRYCDGQGLYLEVRSSGSRGWIQRLTIRGRRAELGLGGFPLVSLKEAREKAFANRKLAREGGDPLSEKRRAESTPTFAEATYQVYNQLRPGWRSPQHAQLWLSSLERYALPRIGGMPVSEVTSADVIGILAPIWHDTAATARKLRQRIRAVMEWAVAMDLRPDNPCDRIGPVLGAQGNGVRHRLALLHGEVASAIETVRASGARPVVKLAFELLVLTAARSGEVRGAVWTEIDRDEGVWSIPAGRTKGNRETGSRCAVVPWRSWRRRGRAAVRWCFRAAPIARRGLYPAESIGTRPGGGGGCAGCQGPQPEPAFASHGMPDGRRESRAHLGSARLPPARDPVEGANGVSGGPRGTTYPSPSLPPLPPPRAAPRRAVRGGGRAMPDLPQRSGNCQNAGSGTAWTTTARASPHSVRHLRAPPPSCKWSTHTTPRP